MRERVSGLPKPVKVRIAVGQDEPATYVVLSIGAGSPANDNVLLRALHQLPEVAWAKRGYGDVVLDISADAAGHDVAAAIATCFFRHGYPLRKVTD